MRWGWLRSIVQSERMNLRHEKKMKNLAKWVRLTKADDLTSLLFLKIHENIFIKKLKINNYEQR